MALQDAGSNTGEPSPKAAAAWPDGGRDGRAAPTRRTAGHAEPPAEGPPVRIYAGTYSPPPENTAQRVDAETGEVTYWKPTRTGEKQLKGYREGRAKRYALRWVARRLLPKGHKTRKCGAWRLPNMDIQVLKSPALQRAYFHGLQVCASPWACPVCAAKISERRSLEVQEAIDRAKALGLSVYLVTLTIPHGLGDDLPYLLKCMHAAWTKLYQGKVGEKFRARIGLRGHIRALEVTYGEANGWHPHFHALLFLDTELVPGQVQQIFTDRWQRCAVRAGLPAPHPDFGCQVDGGDHAQRYVSKGGWGLADELTKGQAKDGRKGRSPRQLLQDYQDGDKQAGALFARYVEAFHGRRQLYWSNGLRALLSVAEMTDEEIVAKPDDEVSMLLATITDDQWKVIYRNRLEAVVLDLAETDPDACRAFIEGVKNGEAACGRAEHLPDVRREREASRVLALAHDLGQHDCAGDQRWAFQGTGTLLRQSGSDRLCL